MKKSIIFKRPGITLENKKKLKALKRKGFYFIKGYKIDDVPLQFTHFYDEYLRFKIVAWPGAGGKDPLSLQFSFFRDSVKESRIKVSHPPLLDSSNANSIKEYKQIRQKNKEILKESKGYINLRYSTMEKVPSIYFESIDEEDLPLFIGDSKSWTHLKDLLGFISNN